MRYRRYIHSLESFFEASPLCLSSGPDPERRKPLSGVTIVIRAHCSAAVAIRLWKRRQHSFLPRQTLLSRQLLLTTTKLPTIHCLPKERFPHTPAGVSTRSSTEPQQCWPIHTTQPSTTRLITANLPPPPSICLAKSLSQQGHAQSTDHSEPRNRPLHIQGVAPVDRNDSSRGRGRDRGTGARSYNAAWNHPWSAIYLPPPPRRQPSCKTGEGPNNQGGKEGETGKGKGNAATYSSSRLFRSGRP